MTPETTSEQGLFVTNLCKSFGGLDAVQDLSFLIPDANIVGLIGPNGAGKTTIFNLLTGFIPADRGSIQWKGKELNGVKSYEIVNRGIARTFQLVKPFPELSLRDNLRVACYSPRFSNKKLSKHQIEDKIDETAGLVGLSEDLDQVAANLGHGDLRLLDIARALLTEPELLLLDEPLSGLSSIETSKIVTFIKKLNEQGLTIFIIEHKLKELMRIADKIVAIDFGTKIAEGTPGQVVANEKVVEAYLGGKKKHVTS